MVVTGMALVLTKLTSLIKSTAAKSPWLKFSEEHNFGQVMSVNSLLLLSCKG